MFEEIPKQTQPFKHKIILVACYFGKLPPYLPLVLRSMAYNSSIDWLIIGDNMPDTPFPENVKFVLSSMREVAGEIEKHCKTPVILNSSYDFHRLKPMYGHCLDKYFFGYHYWGHIDLDVIFGDLRNFLLDDVLENNDRIYCRGHLSIYRNTREVNCCFMRSAPGAPCYKDILNYNNLCTFDEWDGIWKIFRYYKLKQYHKEVIADIIPPTKYKITKFEATELQNYPFQIFYWHEGKTFQAYYHREGGLFDREVAYVHFQKRKLPPHSFNHLNVNGFTICPLGFFPYDRENLSREEMARLNSTTWRPISEIVSNTKTRVISKFRKTLKNANPSNHNRQQLSF
jgi:hypothetical protein